MNPVCHPARPSARQLAWSELELYGIVHFGLNTFTDREWGYGNVPASEFNPTDFDAAAIVDAAAAAGLRGLILVCKHHDGFCLWPTATTDYSVRSAPWRNGRGDLVREFADAVRARGLKFGVYLSPWDRHQASYGTEAYLELYTRQLTELLTGYGELFEVWFDGANGGTGYYGGADELRQVDRSGYYPWPELWALVRRHQPGACIFSDVGPDLRWVGNERGVAGDPCFAAYTPHAAPGERAPAPGVTRSEEGTCGHFDGVSFMPAECDFPLRPGWFYHASEDGLTRSFAELLGCYWRSVGRGASFNVGLAPDPRGRLADEDVRSLTEFGAFLRETFRCNLLTGATRAGQPFSPESELRFSAAPAVLELAFAPVLCNVFEVAERLDDGQRVLDFQLEGHRPGKGWQELFRGSAIGLRRLVRFSYLTLDGLRLTITTAAGSFTLRRVGLYATPEYLPAPEIRRNREGRVELRVSEPGPAIRYTVDGADPVDSGIEYQGPFELPGSAVIRARACLPHRPAAVGPLATRELEVATTGWQVRSVTQQAPTGPAVNVLNEEPLATWHTHLCEPRGLLPQVLELAFDRSWTVSAVTVLPRQDHGRGGLPAAYELELETTPGVWVAAASGEFGNLEANPVRQRIALAEPVRARALRLKITRTVHDSDHLSLAQVGMIGRA